MQKAAHTRKRLLTKKSYSYYSKIHHKYQYSGKKDKHYPRSAYSVKLSKPCPYCNYGTGLVIIRYKDDLGFCRCAKCDAALFSLNESKPEQRLQHIGEILDSYLPYGEAAQ